MFLASAELTLGAQARVDGTLVGSETTETTNPTADTVASFAVADVDRAELELLTVDVRASRAGGDPVTASVDAVWVEVTYSLPPRSLTHDANGALTDDGAGRTFSYDALGRLTGVSGTVDASYAHDGAGRRIGATIDGVSTDYRLDVRGLGSVLADGERRFLPGDPAAGYESAGAWISALANHQGSVLGYADASGLLGPLTHFDPYGAPLPGSTPLAAGPGFTGQWTDATGLIDLRFRAYDPSLQSFLGRDSFGGVASAPLSANRYAYALGNPLRYTDPSGHFVAEFMRHPGLYLSIGLQMLPGIGDAYSLATGAIGFDPIAGMRLSGLERGLAMAAIGPGGGFHLLGRLGGRAGDVAGMAGRSLDELGGVGRSADNLGGVSQAGDSLGGAAGRSADNLGGFGRSGSRRAATQRSGDAVGEAGRAADAAPSTGSSRVARGDAMVARGPLKRGPKPFGMGPHNLKTKEVADSVTDGQIIAGGQTGLPERLIPTPGGMLSARRPDILVQRPDGSLYGINVGRQSPRTGAPIKREAEAINDLEGAGLEMHFVPYP